MEKILNEKQKELVAQLSKLDYYNEIENDYPIELDGIMNHERWNKQKIKILFILKNGYCKEESRECKIHSYAIDNCENENILTINTWKVIKNWKDAILELFNVKDNYDYLGDIAFMNICKKAFTKTNSNNAELTKAKNESFDLLKEQYNGIDADIIVCCNTFDYCHEKNKKNNIFGHSVNQCYDGKNTGKANVKGVEKLYNPLNIYISEGKLIFSVYHPASTCFKTTIEDFEKAFDKINECKDAKEIINRLKRK